MSDPKSTPNGGDQNVDQIRDILFGGQMREYERRFQELAQRLEQEAGRMRAEVEKRFGALEKRFDEQVDKLGKSLRQEVNDRSAAVGDLEARSLQALRAARNEITTSLEQFGQELADAGEREREALSELGAALRQSASESEALLLAARTELRGEKVGREDLAALLTELALRIKGEFELPPTGR